LYSSFSKLDTKFKREQLKVFIERLDQRGRKGGLVIFGEIIVQHSALDGQVTV
jgi:hypothetical protein